MARAATTSDAFNAIAEPQRREILVLLQGGETFDRLDEYMRDLKQARQEEPPDDDDQ